MQTNDYRTHVRRAPRAASARHEPKHELPPRPEHVEGLITLPGRHRYEPATGRLFRDGKPVATGET